MILAAWDWSVILAVGSIVVVLVIGVPSIVIGLKALGVATKQTALAERQTALAERAMRPLLWLHPASYDPATGQLEGGPKQRTAPSSST